MSFQPPVDSPEWMRLWRRYFHLFADPTLREHPIIPPDGAGEFLAGLFNDPDSVAKRRTGLDVPERWDADRE